MAAGPIGRTPPAFEPTPEMLLADSRISAAHEVLVAASNFLQLACGRTGTRGNPRKALKYINKAMKALR